MMMITITDYLGEVVVDVNYLNVEDTVPRYQIFVMLKSCSRQPSQLAVFYNTVRYHKVFSLPSFFFLE